MRESKDRRSQPEIKDQIRQGGGEGELLYVLRIERTVSDKMMMTIVEKIHNFSRFVVVVFVFIFPFFRELCE